MANILFTATGCARCKIAKKFMDERGIPYEDLDIKGQGKEPFGQFYRSNRDAIYRGKEGVEFPVFSDGEHIRQGVGVVLAFLHSGTGLDGFIGRSDLSHGWMDGIHVSDGDPTMAPDLITVLTHISKNGLKLQIDTDGRNAPILKNLLEHGLGDRVIMEVRGPLSYYRDVLGIEPEEVRATMKLVTKFPEHRFQTTLAPVIREPGGSREMNYLTPEEIGEIARTIRESTASNREPYLLRSLDPKTVPDERTKTERLDPSGMFKYRAAARRYLVSAEIDRTEPGS